MNKPVRFPRHSEKERTVYKIIDENERIRYNELRRKVVEDGHMAKNSFERSLNNLLQLELVKRIEIKKQNVCYVTSEEFNNEQIVKWITKLVVMHIRVQFKKIKKNYTKMNYMQKAQAISHLMSAMNPLEFIFSPIMNKLKFLKPDKSLEEVQKIKKEMIEIIIDDSDSKKLLKTLSEIVNNNSIQDINEIKKILKEI
ncbi:MAG: hypothetical protein K5790_02330 [Nitrosopumilus sp.]|uniref:hypothetical protein n=1 Tax=Nitrosopumilus sp. TaxID=2024843 RepID=UPI00247E3D8A|nr:hypothetical protein [Nitrosopumilus sp.]MCV0392112.1 hypothetical protein [Nitrosopumilus sp.]